ncbi:MAG: ABC transporter ATP-binding protein [Thermotogota bacterium]
MRNIIEVEKLTKSYGLNHVLKGLSFEVRENEIFALLGPNGAGKTTTLEIIEGLRKHKEGKINIKGETPKEILKNGDIGVQLQSSSLPPYITIQEAVELFCKWKGIQTRNDLINEFGLKEIRKHVYRTLSTGQKRKLHLALALVNNPKILVLDEPTAGLDVEGRVVLHEKIRELKQKGITIILSSHDMAEVEKLADRVAILLDGKIKTIGNPKEIINSKKEEMIINIEIDKEIDIPNLKDIKLININNNNYKFETKTMLKGINELTNYLLEKKVDIVDLKIEHPTLEEKFVELTNRGEKK